MLDFSRHPQDVRQALIQRMPLDECRQALQEGQRYWELRFGAKFFVRPHQFEETVDLTRKLDLHKQHVVAAESLVSKAILRVSSIQVRVTTRCELGVVGTLLAASSSKASCSGPVGLEAAGENEWQRRENKKRNGVAAVKRSGPYIIDSKLCESGGGNPARPRRAPQTQRTPPSASESGRKACRSCGRSFLRQPALSREHSQVRGKVQQGHKSTCQRRLTD